MRSRSSVAAARWGVLAVALAGAACSKCDKDAAPAGADATSAVASASTPAPSASAAPVAPAEVFTKTAPPALTDLQQRDACGIDLIDGRVATATMPVRSGGTTEMLGWAADPAAGAVPPLVIVELVSATDTFYATASRATAKRPDVAKTFKLPALDASGYTLFADLKDVPPGTYSIKVDQITTAGVALTCDTHRAIKVQ